MERFSYGTILEWFCNKFEMLFLGNFSVKRINVKRVYFVTFFFCNFNVKLIFATDIRLHGRNVSVNG
jgi:hypothetical protein